jgi:hypothetical protein
MLDAHRPDLSRLAALDGGTSACALEAGAVSLWRHACDCDRWGLAWEASEARDMSRSLRVRAILTQALTTA